MRRILVLFLLLAAPMWAADASVTLTLADAYVPAFKAYLLANHPGADVNGNGVLTNQEVLDWIELKAQETLATFAARSVEWAETNDAASLPSAHQTALTSKLSADASLETERAKITP